MSRPKKQVDEEKLCNLAMIGCSHEIIATELGISHDTLTRRFQAQIEKARGKGKMRVMAKAFQMAMTGNARMLELLLINWCNFSLRPETIINVTQNTAPQAPTAADFPERFEAAQRYLEAHPRRL